VLVALNTVQLARRDFLFSDHDQVQSTPEDLCTIRAQNCALFLLTNKVPRRLHLLLQAHCRGCEVGKVTDECP
jgi:hypothetical protein